MGRWWMDGWVGGWMDGWMVGGWMGEVSACWGGAGCSSCTQEWTDPGKAGPRGHSRQTEGVVCARAPWQGQAGCLWGARELQAAPERLWAVGEMWTEL